MVMGGLYGWDWVGALLAAFFYFILFFLVRVLLFLCERYDRDVLFLCLFAWCLLLLHGLPDGQGK